jgi:hypothetical protein
MGRVVPAEVLALIEERQTVENWVAKLADHQADTTPAVFAKVLDDYQSRLAELNTGLAEHHTELQASLDEHGGLVEKLQAEREERAEALEEAKLRFAVGEFDQPLWDIRRQEGETELADLDERLTEEKSTVEELETVLSRMTGGDSASSATLIAPLAVSAADELTSLEQELQEELDQEPEAVEASSDEDADVEDLEEEAVEADSAVDKDEADEIAADAVGQEPPETVELAAAEGKGEGFLDELEFLESLSLDESNKFDAVSAMLDEEEQSDGGEEEERSR